MAKLEKSSEGGFQKIPRKRKTVGDEAKRPRQGSRGRGRPEPQDIPAAEPPVEEKKEREMSRIRVISTPVAQTPGTTAPKAQSFPSMDAAAGAMKAAVSDFKLCPICGRGIRKELTRPDGSKFEPVICNGFYPKQKPGDTEPSQYVRGCMDNRRAYAEDVSQRLLKREQVTVLAFRPWVVAQINIPALEAKVASTKAESDRLNELVVAEAKKMAGGYVPPDVFRNLKSGINHEVLPGEKQTAGQAYGTFMRAQQHLDAAKAEKARLEKEEAEAVAKRAANAPVETPVTPTPDA